MSKKLLVCAFIAVLSGSLAHATTVTYSNLASWQSAAGSPTTVVDFENTVPPNGVNGSDGLTYGGGPFGTWTSSLTNSGVTFSSTGYVFYVSPDNYTDAAFHTSSYLDWQDNPYGTLTVSLPFTTTAFGFQLGSFGGYGGTAIVNVNGTDYSVDYPRNDYAFFGVISDTGINSFTISGVDDYPTMDNLTFVGGAAVPDAAATGPICAATVALLAFLRSRQRRK